jgi:hypothetical protein
LLAHGQWLSPGTPVSSTTKTGHHDIAEILLKVALSIKSNQIKNQHTIVWMFVWKNGQSTSIFIPTSAKGVVDVNKTITRES